jgi:hypothetical protein
MKLKSFNKEEKFSELFHSIDSLSKMPNPANQLIGYVKLADFLERIAIEAYEEGFKDAINQEPNQN